MLLMARNARTEAIFTTADDQMQGLWGLHRYLKAAAESVEPESLVSHFPERAFRVTHGWVRGYNPQQLTRTIRDIGIDFLISRSSLVSLVTICEAALVRFNTHLSALGYCEPQSKHKKLLAWAFAILQKYASAAPNSDEILARLPETCGDLDNARRLRNCIVHNNGCYIQRYLDDLISDGWVKPQYEKDSPRAVPAREPIFLTSEGYEHFSRSHIEFLHVLHNTIQHKFFGHADGYNYGEEGKAIEWFRILSGRRDLDM